MPHAEHIERQRKLHLGMWVRAMVMSAGTPGGAYQATSGASYVGVRCPRSRVRRSTGGSTHPSNRVGQHWRSAPWRMLAQQVDLPGPLSGVKDWDMVDSTTVTVRDALRADGPGTGA